MLSEVPHHDPIDRVGTVRLDPVEETALEQAGASLLGVKSMPHPHEDGAEQRGTGAVADEPHSLLPEEIAELVIHSLIPRRAIIAKEKVVEGGGPEIDPDRRGRITILQDQPTECGEIGPKTFHRKWAAGDGFKIFRYHAPMPFLIYCVLVWSLAPWPFSLWLLVLGAATDDRCREPFKDALYWDPQRVTEIACRNIESGQTGRGRMADQSRAGARPRRH
jgi:hypothetical protein